MTMLMSTAVSLTLPPSLVVGVPPVVGVPMVMGVPMVLVLVLVLVMVMVMVMVGRRVPVAGLTAVEVVLSHLRLPSQRGDGGGDPGAGDCARYNVRDRGQPGTRDLDLDTDSSGTTPCSP